MSPYNCFYGSEPQPGAGVLFNLDELDLEILLVAIPSPWDIEILALVRLFPPYNPVTLCAKPFPGWPEFTLDTISDGSKLLAWAEQWGEANAWQNT